jgi:putative thioredoxin
MNDISANSPQTLGNLSGAPGVVKDSSTAEFSNDVIVASQEVPVLVDFWSESCGPCKQLGPMIEQIVREKAGAVKLVKLNIEQHPEVAQQLQVQSIPAVFAFVQGRPVDGFVGAQPESQIRSFIDRIIKTGGGAAGPSPLDAALDQAAVLLEGGDPENAAGIYTQILQQQTGNITATAGMAKCLMAAGQMDAAKQLLDEVPADKQVEPEISAVRAALELADEAAEAIGQSAELEAAVAANPKDHQARFDLSRSLFAQGNGETAVEHLLAIMRHDRNWNEQAARRQLIKIFEALGPEDPVTISGRQGLSSILFS